MTVYQPTASEDLILYRYGDPSLGKLRKTRREEVADCEKLVTVSAYSMILGVDNKMCILGPVEAQGSGGYESSKESYAHWG